MVVGWLGVKVMCDEGLRSKRHLRTKIPTPYHKDTQSNIIETPWKYKHTSIVTMGSSSNYHYTAATRPVL